jgi:hypothetical protein
MLRFRRSIRILPGIRVNLGKRGASLSIGAKGAHVTIGHGKVRETIGLPGTGVSFTHTSHQAHAKAAGPAQPAPVAEPPESEPLPVGVAWRGWLWIAIGVVILASVVVRLVR